MIGICARRAAVAWTAAAAAVANGLLAPWFIQIASLLKSNFLVKQCLLSSKSLLGKILVWKMSCFQIEIHLIHDTSEVILHILLHAGRVVPSVLPAARSRSCRCTCAWPRALERQSGQTARIESQRWPWWRTGCRFCYSGPSEVNLAQKKIH